MSIFGWDYPAGAEHDPNAPWNAVAPNPTRCDDCDHEGASEDYSHGEACDVCEIGTMQELENCDYCKSVYCNCP